MQNARSGHAFFKQSSLLLSAWRNWRPWPIRLILQMPTLPMRRELARQQRRAPSDGACLLMERSTPGARFTHMLKLWRTRCDIDVLLRGERAR